jgi:hypothetical protein
MTKPILLALCAVGDMLLSLDEDMVYLVQSDGRLVVQQQVNLRQGGWLPWMAGLSSALYIWFLY